MEKIPQWKAQARRDAETHAARVKAHEDRIAALTQQERVAIVESPEWQSLFYGDRA